MPGVGEFVPIVRRRAPARHSRRRARLGPPVL